ncbi:hypothetical protein PENTCL1PPCAC_2760, partial [Pristionchus entomophagus]
FLPSMNPLSVHSLLLFSLLLHDTNAKSSFSSSRGGSYSRGSSSSGGSHLGVSSCSWSLWLSSAASSVVFITTITMKEDQEEQFKTVPLPLKTILPPSSLPHRTFLPNIPPVRLPFPLVTSNPFNPTQKRVENVETPVVENKEAPVSNPPVE